MKNLKAKLNRLFQKYPKFHLDKVAHFLVGALVSFIFLLIFSPGAGFAAAFIVGLAKEYYDHEKNGAGGLNTWLDWISTMLGGAVVELFW